jgi:peptidoglycan/LPS O-acetylase OafA/YrhL
MATAIAVQPDGTVAQSASAARRVHEMDGLRAFAMLLGVVMHSAFFLAHIGPPEHRGALRHLMYGLHLFRMPLFFLVAGYFGALIVSRRGTRGFVSARARRIGIPLAVGLVTVIPATHYALVLTHPRYHEPLLPLRPFHLWFLWFLVLFSLGAVAVRWAVGRFGLHAWVQRARVVAGARWWPVLAVAVFTLTLWSSPLPWLSDPGSFVPTPGVLLGYSLFYAFGWLLFGHPDPVAHIGRHWRLAALATPALLVLGRVLSLPYGRGDLSPAMEWLARLTCAATTWAILVALFGATRRWYRAERPAVRYTADLAYWLYLIHVPIVILAVYAATQAGLSTVGAFVASASVTYAICFLTYSCFVRYTAIGRVLHGRRARPHELRLVPSGA